MADLSQRQLKTEPYWKMFKMDSENSREHTGNPTENKDMLNNYKFIVENATKAVFEAKSEGNSERNTSSKSQNNIENDTKTVDKKIQIKKRQKFIPGAAVNNKMGGFALTVPVGWYSYHYKPERKDKFLWFTNVVSGGLNDRTENLKVLIKASIVLNRIPILVAPPLHAERHNKGVTLTRDTWNTYYNMSRATYSWPEKNVFDRPLRFISDREAFRSGMNIGPGIRLPGNTKSISNKLNENKLIEIDTSNPRYAQYSNLPLLQNAKIQNKKIRVTLPPSNTVLGMGESILKQLRAKSSDGMLVTLHIRRGDKLTRSEYMTDECNLDRDTQPDHIIKRLLAQNITPPVLIYILTNEADPTFFDPLTEAGYIVVQEFNLTEFQDLRRGENTNNFLIYAAEKYVQAHADKDVRTFKVRKTHPPVVGYISECEGWT
eukprot:CFRG6881T1